MSEFLATRLGAVLAAVGIVMSAIALAQGGESLEVAANALFLVASTLELFATAGLWATSAFGIATVGGIAVGTIFAVVSVIGVIALVAGVVLIAILLFRPQKSPVEKFAEDQAGVYFMPFKTDIDYFQEYQTGTAPQRSGVSLMPNGVSSRALYIGSDGSLHQRPFDGTGHTAFYMRVDEFGRAQIGAPVLDTEGKRTFFVLGVDDAGNLVAPVAPNETETDERLLWRAEVLSQGEYDEGEQGTFLRSANFRLYNEHIFRSTGNKSYLNTSGDNGWTLTVGMGVTIKIEMMTSKPEELSMLDIEWFTFQHDQNQAASLGVPGSAPRSWTLSPELPPGLMFDAETGIVSMEIGVDVPVAAPQTYQLTVNNAAGATSTQFQLSVQKPTSVAADS